MPAPRTCALPTSRDATSSALPPALPQHQHFPASHAPCDTRPHPRLVFVTRQHRAQPVDVSWSRCPPPAQHAPLDVQHCCMMHSCAAVRLSTCRTGAEPPQLACPQPVCNSSSPDDTQHPGEHAWVCQAQRHPLCQRDVAGTAGAASTLPSLSAPNPLPQPLACLSPVWPSRLGASQLLRV